MTSNNTIVYNIYNKKGECVGNHSQNIMCRRNNDRLMKYIPASEYMIQMVGYDEEEDEELEGVKYSLEKWLVDNPAEFTFQKFEIGDKAKTTLKVNGKNKKTEVVVLEVFEGKYHRYYIVKDRNGNIFKDVQQTRMMVY